VTEFRQLGLKTGVRLNVALAGDSANPAVILLHGFPESHRTWREISGSLAERFHLIMPDQRGFGGSDLPQDVQSYKTDVLIDDVFALCDELGVDRFALVGHDWGGAITWGAALREDPRLSRIAIINAPHPVIFQKSLIEDEGQRSASQYITAFRTPGFETAVEVMGFDEFFDKTFARHVNLEAIGPAEKQQYLADWSQPGGVQRNAQLVSSIAGDRAAARPHRADPRLAAPRLPQGEGSDACRLGHEGCRSSSSAARGT
jgi:pimeloyl-ACP methyl ester carboxylesterase